MTRRSHADEVQRSAGPTGPRWMDGAQGRERSVLGDGPKLCGQWRGHAWRALLHLRPEGEFGITLLLTHGASCVAYVTAPDDAFPSAQVAARYAQRSAEAWINAACRTGATPLAARAWAWIRQRIAPREASVRAADAPGWLCRTDRRSAADARPGEPG